MASNGQLFSAMAGASVIQVDWTGALLRHIRIVPSSDLPQSAAFAEHLAAVTLMRYSGDAVESYFDCQNVIASWERGFLWASDAGRPHGGLWRQQRRPAGLRVHKVKAHGAWTQDMTNEQLLHHAVADLCQTTPEAST